MKKFLCSIALFMLTFFLFNNSTYAATNLVQNDSFEEVSGNMPVGWGTSVWDSTENASVLKVENSIGRAGNNFVTIVNNKNNDARFKQDINVEENKKYKFSCFIKAHNVSETGAGACISILGYTEKTPSITETNGEWKQVEMYVQTGTGTTKLSVSVGLGNYSAESTGTASFDNVSFVEVNEIPQNAIVTKVGNVSSSASSNTNSSAAGSSSIISFLQVIFILIVVIAFAALIYYLYLKSKGISENKRIIDSKINKKNNIVDNRKKTVEEEDEKQFKLVIDKKDIIIMLSMTLIYAVIALVNLGSINVPETSWSPKNQGENFVVDFQKDVQISKLYYYCGLDVDTNAKGQIEVQYLDSYGRFDTLTSFQKQDIFIWKTLTVQNLKTSKLRFIVDSPGFTLNEITFFGPNSDKPIGNVKLSEINGSSADTGKVENLFDEQNKVDYKHSYLSGMIFDEIYHARTAYEYLHGLPIYEWTHPPLGKLLISVGIAIFGMNPFGWRVVGTLFGVAMVPIMYLFGRKMFEKKFYAFCAAFLIMFDFMHYSLTRIATIDVYGTFFVILMYYFMYDYFMLKAYKVGFKKSLKPLFFCGVFLGIGAASKWIGLYAAAGLAFLFFARKYKEYKEYSIKKIQRLKLAWLKDYIPVYLRGTILWCVLFFIVIPVLIYLVAYIPYMNITKGGLNAVIQNQKAMYIYHSYTVLGATHPFSSQWWEWPIMRRPLETYLGYDLPAGMSSTMTIMGNPAIWWVGIPAVIAAAIISIRNRDKKMLVVFVAMASQYIPWIGIKRLAFIYHFFSVVPFMILAIVYVLKYINEKLPHGKKFIYGYLAIVAIMFIMFYPVLSGMEVSRSYVEHYLLWFKGHWYF